MKKITVPDSTRYCWKHYSWTMTYTKDFTRLLETKYNGATCDKDCPLAVPIEEEDKNGKTSIEN